ncbi:thioredoxin-like protein [Camelus ferus]|nr:thioredoxin-like protein [Camelus ferus]
MAKSMSAVGGECTAAILVMGSFEAGGIAAAFQGSLRMVGVKPVGSDPDFQPELSGAGSRLAVVKFTMRGCGPCLRIAPAFSSMSNKYPQAVFLEVDVHQCQGTAATNNISATPTFLFFRNKVRIDQYQGADAVGLEEKIKQHLENDPGSNEDTDIPKGYMDLMPFINKAGCECLNESDEHGFDNCLRKDMTFLESDCDEQLLITVAFNQPVKLYSMKFQGPDNGQGPKYVKIFINLPRSMDFEEAERSEPTQALELTEDDIKEDGIVPLRYVKFQNVNSVTRVSCANWYPWKTPCFLASLLFFSCTKGTRRTGAGPTVDVIEDVGIVKIGKVLGQHESVVSTE